MRNLLLFLFTLVITASANAQVTCNASISASTSGSTVTVTNSSTPVATTTIYTSYQYVWGDGQVSYANTNASQVHTYLVGGNYTIMMIQQVMDSNATNPSWCRDTAFASVSVTGVPCATTITKVNQGNNTWKFTANNLNSTPNMTYSWSFGDGGTATGSPVTHQYTTNGTYTVKLISSNGSCTDSQTTIINVNTPSTACSVAVSRISLGNNSWKFTAHNLNNTPNMTFAWNFGDGTTGTGSPITHQYTTGGAFTVKVVGSNGSCADSAFTTVSSTLFNRISGLVYVDSSSTVDSYKVWLIKYDSSTSILSAVDSVIIPTFAGSGYYLFNNHAAGAYRTKAALHNGPTSGTGHVPTYHNSSLVWSSATIIYHNGGHTSGKDIFMQTGTLTSGPGFVAGNVNQGANKGSANGIPGMTVFLMDMAGNAVQYSVTDANGYYSFNNIPDGSYNVYPEDLGINTTAAAVSIASGSVTHTDVHFERSLSKKTIVPIAAGIANINSKGLEYSIYPNPAKESVTIGWNANSADKAQISIADVSGKVVYSGVATMNSNMTINVSNLQSGLYFLNISSDMGNSTQKLIIK